MISIIRLSWHGMKKETWSVAILKTNKIEMYREMELETGRARGIQAVF